LFSGTYMLTSRVSLNLTGSPGLPIVIRSKPGEAALIRRNDNTQNILDGTLVWTYWYDLELSGGSAGLRLEGDSHHNVFDDLDIHSTASSAMFRSSDPNTITHHNIIQNCHIHDPVGMSHAAMMSFGCSDASCSFRNNLIHRNHLHSALNNQFDGGCLVLFRGSFGNVVSDNVIHDCPGNPAVFSYGTDGNEPNRLTRNIISNAMNDHCIQITSNTAAVGNVIANCDGAGIGVLPIGGTPRDILISHNTIYSDLSVSISGIAAGTNSNVLLTHNLLLDGHIYGDDIPEITISNNVGTVSGKGISTVLSAASAVGSLPSLSPTFTVVGANFHPLPAAVSNLTTSDTLSLDLDCRLGTLAGAVQTAKGTANVWSIQHTFKPDCRPCPPMTTTTTSTTTVTPMPTPKPTPKPTPTPSTTPSTTPSRTPSVTPSPTPRPTPTATFNSPTTITSMATGTPTTTFDASTATTTATATSDSNDPNASTGTTSLTSSAITTSETSVTSSVSSTLALDGSSDAIDAQSPLPAALIGGVVGGVLALLLIIAVAVAVVCRRSKKPRESAPERAETAMTATSAPPVAPSVPGRESIYGSVTANENPYEIPTATSTTIYKQTIYDRSLSQTNSIYDQATSPLQV
jgi:hypothetical protein